MNTLAALGLGVLATLSPVESPLKPVKVEPIFETVTKPASEIDKVVNASFQLHRNNSPWCSGQFVTPTVYLTAAHCVVNSSGEVVPTDQFSIQLDRYGVKQKFDLEVLKVNTNYDTATLKLVDENTSFPHVEVAPLGTKMVAGETVVNVSFPGVEDYYFITEGTWTSETDVKLDGLLGNFSYIVSIDTIGGSSGSGLYVNRDGHLLLIGTLQGGPPAHDYMNWFSVLRGVHSVIPAEETND